MEDSKLYSKLLSVKNLKLAKIKYFDMERNGAEVTNIDAYVFLYEEDGEIYNLLDKARVYPIYNRVPYTNTTLDGESYGTKIVHVAGEERSGPCYIIDVDGCSDYFGRVNMFEDEIKEYVLRSDKFFPDRYQMLLLAGPKARRKYAAKMVEDQAKIKELDDYLEAPRENSFYR